MYLNTKYIYEGNVAKIANYLIYKVHNDRNDSIHIEGYNHILIFEDKNKYDPFYIKIECQSYFIYIKIPF